VVLSGAGLGIETASKSLGASRTGELREGLADISFLYRQVGETILFDQRHLYAILHNLAESFL